MDNINVLARGIIGGYGGGGSVECCPAVGPLAGHVKVKGQDAFGNQGEGTFDGGEWRKAIAAAIVEFPT